MALYSVNLSNPYLQASLIYNQEIPMLPVNEESPQRYRNEVLPVLDSGLYDFPYDRPKVFCKIERRHQIMRDVFVSKNRAVLSRFMISLYIRKGFFLLFTAVTIIAVILNTAANISAQ